MKIQKTNKGQFYLTLPRALVEAKRWDKGTKVKVRLNEKGNLELEEVKDDRFGQIRKNRQIPGA